MSLRTCLHVLVDSPAVTYFIAEFEMVFVSRDVKSTTEVGDTVDLLTIEFDSFPRGGCERACNKQGRPAASLLVSDCDGDGRR